MQTQKILRWGNSLAVRLSRNVAADLEVHEGSSVNLSLSRGRLIIEPARELRLDDLVAAISPENQHAEVPTGPARGNEIW